MAKDVTSLPADVGSSSTIAGVQTSYHFNQVNQLRAESIPKSITYGPGLQCGLQLHS